jgi:hypothetical protein
LINLITYFLAAALREILAAMAIGTLMFQVNAFMAQKQKMAG